MCVRLKKLFDNLKLKFSVKSNKQIIGTPSVHGNSINTPVQGSNNVTNNYITNNYYPDKLEVADENTENRVETEKAGGEKTDTPKPTTMEIKPEVKEPEKKDESKKQATPFLHGCEHINLPSKPLNTSKSIKYRF